MAGPGFTGAGGARGSRGQAAGAVLAGRFEVLCRLGGGGMGEVYRVRDLELGVEVALKLIKADLAAESGLVARFRREVAISRALNHRHTVDVHDIGADGGRPFYTMEYVPGESLRARLRGAGGGLDLHESVRVVEQVLDALDYARRCGGRIRK